MIITTPFLASLALALQAAPEPAENASENVAVQEAETPNTEEAEQVGPEKADASVKAAKKSDEDKIICRRTAVVGSKFKKRICGTKKEWAEMSRRGQDNALEFQQRGNGFEPVN